MKLYLAYYSNVGVLDERHDVAHLFAVWYLLFHLHHGIE